MSKAATSKASPAVTSSQELQDGRLHYAWQAGPMIYLSGPDHPLASPSRLRVDKKARPTLDTWPQRGSGWSKSRNLQSCLANRLRKQLAQVGSMIYATNWSFQVTPAGRAYWRQGVSGRRISAYDYFSPRSGWQTPTVSARIGGRSESSAQRRAEQRLTTGRTSVSVGNLAEQMEMYYSGWPTATASDITGGGSQACALAKLANVKRPSGQTKSAQLRDYAQLMSWPTALANDQKGSDYSKSGETRILKLPGTAKLFAWPTSTASDVKGSGPTVIRKDGKDRTFQRIDFATEQGLKGFPIRITARGEILTGYLALTGISGQLDPAHSRWLMGYPESWDRAAPHSKSWQAATEMLASKATETPLYPAWQLNSLQDLSELLEISKMMNCEDDLL